MIIGPRPFLKKCAMYKSSMNENILTMLFAIRYIGVIIFIDLLLTTDMLDFLGFFLRRNTAHK